MRVRNLVAAAALWAAAFATTAAHAADACIPAADGEALFMAMAPSAITAVAGKCAPVLPEGAFLRRPADQLAAKYTAEADAAWPRAGEAIKKLAGSDSALFSGDLIRATVTAMIAGKIGEELKPADCPAVDRILTLIDPLPAKNTAALVVTIVELSNKPRPGKKTDFNLCPSLPVAGGPAKR